MTNWQFADREILVVEDDYFIAEEVTLALDEAGACVVGPAAKVEQALRLVAATENLACGLLDVHLQDEVVYPVAVELQRIKVPFIFLTGYDAEAIHPDFATVPRLEKPFNIRHAAFALTRAQQRIAAQT